MKNKNKKKATTSAWITGQEILNKEKETSPWLVDKLIPRVGLCGITGPSDCGKSTLVKQLCLAIASGDSHFLGRKIEAKHKKCAYVSTEEAVDDVQHLLECQKDAFDSPGLSSVAFYFSDEDIEYVLEGYMLTNKVDLIILDTWSDTIGGDANAMHNVRQSLKPLRDLAIKYDCAILIVHHNVKYSERSSPDKNKTSGSQAIEAKLRVLIDFRLAKKPDERLLTIVKANSLPPELKGVSEVLAFDRDTRVFRNTNTYASALEFVKNAQKYNLNEWQEKYDSVAEQGQSMSSTIKKLREQYKEDNVPGDTWFKTHIVTKADDEESKSKEVEGE